VVKAFEKASGVSIPYKIVDRRSGDVPSSYADPTLAEKELDWKATRGIHEMCKDVWRWQSGNPQGYEEDL
jgi:UDP-glucose 4-epimerase